MAELTFANHITMKELNPHNFALKNTYISNLISTASVTSSSHFVSDITYNNGHITQITRSPFNITHTHSINNVSFGIGQNINIVTALNSILSISSSNKTITLDVNPKTFKNGVIAQQLKQILPQAVIQRQDGYLAVDYNQIIPLLIQCIKQQGKQIKQLRMTKNANIDI